MRRRKLKKRAPAAHINHVARSVKRRTVIATRRVSRLGIAFIADPEIGVGGDAHRSVEQDCIPRTDCGGVYHLAVNKSGRCIRIDSCPDLDGIDTIGFLGHKAHSGDGTAQIICQSACIMAMRNVKDCCAICSEGAADCIGIAIKYPITNCRCIPK